MAQKGVSPVGIALGSGKSQPLRALCFSLSFSLALSTKPTLTPVELKESPDPISILVALTFRPEGQEFIAPFLWTGLDWTT